MSTSLFADRATDLVDKSEAVYSRAGAFSAKFTQVVSTGDFFDDEKTDGVLMMSYPRKFRIDTPDQVIASDGDSLWSYSAENKQVTIDAASKSKDVATPADYLFNFKQNYTLEYDSTAIIGKTAVHQLSLKSKVRDQYVRSLKLFLDAENFTVRRVIYRDINDNRITLDFSGWKLGIKIAPEQFRFKTPRGVEEVRLP
jgi:outer membrane lipoprotein-sorting protein